MPDARCTRGRLCRKKHRRQQPGVHRINRHSLHNGVTAYTRSPGDRALLPPSPRGSYPARLSASVGAPGPHDFASAKASLVAQETAPDAPRPSHPASYVRDDREAPLLWNGTATNVNLIWGLREAIYFCREGWTGFCKGEVICPTRLGKNSNYGTGVARSVTTSSHSAMLAWNVCKTSRNARRAEARPHLQATHAFSAMYATNRSKPRMLSTRVKL